MRKKIIVIGDGPAGYSTALEAARLGADVTLAEERQIGGTCLDTGCMQTKTALQIVGFYRDMTLGRIPGVKAGAVALDWEERGATRRSLWDG